MLEPRTPPSHSKKEILSTCWYIYHIDVFCCRYFFLPLMKFIAILLEYNISLGKWWDNKKNQNQIFTRRKFNMSCSTLLCSMFRSFYSILFVFLIADASSTNEAVHLQQRLKSLSSELVTLRNRLHVDNANVDVTLPGEATTTGTAAAVNLVTSSNAANLTNGPFVTNHHSNMQIGSSAIPITNKSNPKVSVCAIENGIERLDQCQWLSSFASSVCVCVCVHKR